MDCFFRVAATVKEIAKTKCDHIFCSCRLQALSGKSGFMAANLYALSMFGEDALAKVSIEIPVDQGPEFPVTGHFRIRTKSQVRDSGTLFSVTVTSWAWGNRRL